MYTFLNSLEYSWDKNIIDDTETDSNQNFPVYKNKPPCINERLKDRYSCPSVMSYSSINKSYIIFQFLKMATKR